MRGSIEMNTLKQIATRAMVFVFALSVLVPAMIMAGDNNIVQAEKLASVYLTNKGTAKTTESSPPTARANPASRSTVSTLYATMTDVDTANATKNSHILDSNKIVITVDEADYNTKVNIVSGANDHQAAAVAASSTIVVTGLANNPVIDSDSDGDLTDEVYYKNYANGATACSFNGSAVSCTGTARTTVLQTVSVANGAAATSNVAPMITAIVTTADGNSANGDDIYTGYYSSAVNTFQVSAWSTVQLESNASVISVVETGRNTGIFEAEFVIADTEGANDNVNATSLLFDTNAGDNAGTGGRCDAGGANAAVSDNAGGPGTLADGRYDRSGGVDADCEILTIAMNDVAATAQNASIALTTGATVPAGQKIWDADGDGSILDEHFFSVQSTEALAAANRGYSVDGKMEATALTCGGSAANCTNGVGGAVVLTVTLDGAAIANGSDDLVVSVPLKNNVVDNAKVDGEADGTIGNTVTSDDLKSNRPGSDTISTGGGTVTSNTNIKTAVPTTGMDRTPVVEAQANSTITVQYQDLTDNSSATSATTGTKVKATATIDVDAPTPVVTSPTSGSSFKDRQPSFAGSATDIGSGLDVSTVALYVDVLDDGSDTAATLQASSGSWLGGAGSIDLQDEYRQTIATLDNTTTMVDGVTSVTWTVTTSTNIPCLTVNDDSSTPNSGGGASHTNFANIATTCASAKSEPDVSLDYFSSATDIAGNRGFSDSNATNTAGSSLQDNYSFNIDELKPSLDAANTETGVYWNAATTAEKTGDTTKIVVAFDDEISAAPASSFEVTNDAGAIIPVSSTEVGTKGTTAAGASYDKRKDVYLTLSSALATSDTPKVKLVGNITDLAGNSNKSGNVANAVDKLKPSLTLALSGGSGTGSSPDDSVGLTKSSMTMTITTSEVLSGVPTVSIFSEDYGTGATYAKLAADSDCGAVSAGADCSVTISTNTVVDTDKDGSLTDEIVIAVGEGGAAITAADLVGMTIKSVTNSVEDVAVVITSTNALVNGTNDLIRISGNFNAAYNATGNETAAEGTVTAVAVDATTYTATFSGTSFSDAAAKDTKAVIVSADDVNGNTGTLGTRDQSSSSVYKFRLDKTAPVLKNDPDGDGTVGSTTTLPRPYVIFEFTDNSKVTVVSASFGGDDVLAKLATTNSKKYFMVPDADLAAKTYAVAAKGTDLAGNKGAEGSYNMKVSTRKDYKATILAGWNLMSFPSDPISNGVSTVFSNTGVDQVVGYDAMAKGSPWSVATKDSATQVFSGGLDTIHAGSGYWVHSTEFSTQSVSLTGPEGPSASAPPSIEAISLASGWNLVGITDATKALTQANEGAIYKGVEDYLGADGGSSITKAFTYDTTGLAWSAKDLTSNGGDVLIGQAYWVYAKPDANGMLTPIVP
tara:strand:- start:1403 stop:5572 length:4170 start_codon:yes stop_codon:yes gene_type:complete